jgi:predicted MPP superfamily phosphohydrolase
MTTILHLTDLHFGQEPPGSPSRLAQRVITLEALRETLAGLRGPARPDVVVVSGDIGWAGRASDYTAAAEWLRSLLGVLELAPERLVVCPGNHDLDRAESEVLERPEAAVRADHLLRVEKLVQISRPFAAFTAFARDMGLAPLRVGETESYLVGERRLCGLRFVVFNTAWFCRDEHDQGKLFIGLPQLEVMEAAGQLVRPAEYDRAELTVAVLHHPETWLKDNETTAYEGRPATYSYLAQRSHLLLSGHTHGGLEGHRRIADAGLLFMGGAGYDGPRYRNNVSLLRVDTAARTVVRTPYEFDPRDGRWHIREATSHSLCRGAAPPHGVPPPSVVEEIAGTDYPLLRARAHRHAVRYVETKSRAVARTRTLPEIHSRRVGLQDPAERVRRRRGEVLLRTEQHSLPFREAAASGRPVFLLGEMGSGKSTLVGQLAAELNLRPEGLLALIVPAKHFLGRPLLDVRALLAGVDAYVREQVAPELPGFTLGEALREQEVTLVLDGVDEMDLAGAGALLARAEDAAELYAQLRVIATGRPVELRGLDYGRWQLLTTLPLSREDRLLILTEEARADGAPGEEAAEDARRRLDALERAPELQEVADTPLVLRLLRPRLGDDLTRMTVGDLLLEVLDERLAGWGQREGKEQARPAFAAALPDAHARGALLGRIAAAVYRSPERTITRHVLLSYVEEAVGGGEERARTVAEGADLLRTAFFEGDEQLAFTSQPLLQCALGIHIARAVREGREADLVGTPAERWREVSFAATALRRAGITAGEGFLGRYVDGLFAEGGTDVTPAAAAVAAEFLDRGLALRVLEHLRRLGFRPLRFFSERTVASAGHYARLFVLAGSEGFDWYFRQYLDPRFPSSPYEHREHEVLRHWLVLRNYTLEEEERQRLVAAAEPHIAVHSSSCEYVLPAISLAAPEAYAPEMRARLAVLALENVLLRGRAEAVLRSLAHSGLSTVVLAALEAVLEARSDRSVAEPALLLWRELSGAAAPPPVIARALVSRSAGADGVAALSELAASLGVADTRGLLRWYAMGEHPAATHAALRLYRDGVRSFPLLAPGLLQGIKGYPAVEEAERALDQLLAEEGERGLTWLADRIVTHERGYGAAPALWRLLLRALERREQPWPELLRHCLSGLGDSTLPRHPEIRRGFQQLLAREPAYREDLRDALGALDRAVRYHAACVLLATDPAAEVRAIDVVVAGTGAGHESQEWNRFAIRLDLGAPVLQRLREILPDLPTVQRTFALLLLHHNSVELTSDQMAALIDGVLGEAHWLDRPTHREYETGEGVSVLRDATALPHLLGALQADYGRRATSAASALLDHHAAHLTAAQLARAWVLAFSPSAHIPFGLKLRDLRTRMKDPAFAATFEEAVADVRSHTHEEPGSSLVVRTFRDPGAWRDLLWQLLMARHAGLVVEGARPLFEAAEADPAVGAVIGSAARDFLARIGEEDGRSERSLLTVFAHEYGGLPTAELSSGIQGSEEEVWAALIARGASLPEHVISGGSNRLLFAELPSPPTPLTIQDALELARDAEHGPQVVLGFLEGILLQGGFAPTEIVTLAEHSRTGALAASLLAICSGQGPEPRWVVRALGAPVSHHQGRESDVARLREVVRNVLLRDPEFRTGYLEALETDRRAGMVSEGSSLGRGHLVRELLAVRGQLVAGEWEALIEEVANSPYSLNVNTAHQVADALAKMDASDASAMLPVLQRAGRVLQSGDPKRLHSLDETLALLVMGLALLWLEDETSTTAEHLFLLALPHLLLDRDPTLRNRNEGPQLRGGEVVSAVWPLLQQVPAARLQHCLAAGLRSDVPEVRACCRLLAALTATPSPKMTDPDFGGSRTDQ